MLTCLVWLLLIVGRLCKRLPHTVDVAGHELQRGVAELRAARVGHGHPAVQVRLVVVAVHREHVVGVPRQARREIGRLDPVARAALVGERPDERRPREQVAGELRKADVIGVQAGDDLAADLPHGGAVVAEKPRDHFLVAAHQRDVAAHVLPQELLGLEQVVLVVLLEHAHARRLAERAEVDGRRVHGGGDVHELEVERASRQLQQADVANERQVGVVDRERQLALVVERRGVLASRRLGCGREGA
jgi:hypothetical protein